MFCKNCGNEILEGEKFCSKCGNKTETEKSNNKFPLGIIIALVIVGIVAIIIISNIAVSSNTKKYFGKINNNDTFYSYVKENC